ncbi:MAG: MBL fold metallo-hydrolase [Candidatus Wildermuthbacteria bacterium]|nr:MBL fold metallo-hydrolase [Candidatus Wildermuthbacteria bacterium]
MQITWKGQACIFLSGSAGKEQVRVLVDPYHDSIGFNFPSTEADVVLITHDHPDHNNVQGVKGEPFVISNPGEYDVKGVFIQGIHSFHDGVEGKERGTNTIYTIEMEDMRLCHLGDLGQKELTAEQLEKIGNVDILFVPVGGVDTLDGTQAAEVIEQIEPKLAVPIHYALPKLKYQLDGVDTFLRTMGRKDMEAQPKIMIRAKDLPTGETSVVVLKP